MKIDMTFWTKSTMGYIVPTAWPNPGSGVYQYFAVSTIHKPGKHGPQYIKENLHHYQSQAHRVVGWCVSYEGHIIVILGAREI